MFIYLAREYQQGEESGDVRAYAEIESARAWLESRWPEDRVVWKEPFDGMWVSRLRRDRPGDRLYITRMEVRGRDE